MRWRAAVALLLSCGWLAAAERPTLDHFFPPAAARGTTNTLTVFGKSEPWPPSAWSTCTNLAFSFTTNKSKVEVTVPADTPAGACLVRVYNSEGASEPCIFVVTEKAEIEEKEPNNHFSKPQVITNYPVTINGRLEKNGDVDSFGFKVKAGEWLDARVESYTLMAKIDPVLRLLRTNGYQLAWNHDFGTLDPRLIWRAPRDEEVVLQIFGFLYPANAEIQLAGGPGGVYRLHLATSGNPPSDVCVESTEHEPNNSRTNALAIQLPSLVVGTICPAGDEDRFRLALKKDQFIEANVEAAALGSPLDAWLKIEDNDGKEITRNDDAGNSRDPRLEWKAAADGEYYLVLGSTTHEGSQSMRYRLTVNPAPPDYRANAAASSVVLTPGATNDLKFTLKRVRGFTNELSYGLKGLPETVSLLSTNRLVKDGENTLQLFAPTNAVAFNGPIELVIHDKGTSSERAVPFELVSRSENNGVPGGYSKLLVESLDQLWLTIKPPAEPKPKTEK